MSDEQRVQQLIDELHDSDATPDQVCAATPELLPVVRERWRRVRRMRDELDAMFPPEQQDTPTSDARLGSGPLPRIPGYDVDAILGRGGMGVVFKARHLRLNRLVALKMASAGAYASAQDRERFQREAEAVAALRHPNVVQIYDVGESDGQSYFTMEYVDGGSLAEKLDGTPLPAREAAAITGTLAAAVHAAHTCGILHRDLKPANVLLTSEGVPKIGDFGLARRLDGDGGLTRTGTAVGTPSYMAPEQARGSPDAVGAAADTYSLGAILYELLTGRPPFRGETAADTVHQLLTQDPLPPSRLNPKVPRDLETICAKCLQKEPSERYASAAELSEDLGRFMNGEAIAARPEGRLRRFARKVRRRPALPAAVAACILLMLALVGVGSWTQYERSKAARAVEADRLAMERAVEIDLEAMERALGESSWPAASAAIDRARLRLGKNGDPRLHLRLERGVRDLELIDRLDGIWLKLAQSHNGVIDYASCDRAYDEAFRGAGLGSLNDAPTEVAARIRVSSIRFALIATLDQWSTINTEQARQKWAMDVARLADHDPTGWRTRARDPAVRSNTKAFFELIDIAPVVGQSVSLLITLQRLLDVRSQRNLKFMRRIHSAYPDDFWVNLRLGYTLLEHNKPEEAVRYFQAATAIRPRVALGYHNLAYTLILQPKNGTNDYQSEAIAQYQRAVELDPTAGVTRSCLGLLLSGIARHDEAIEQFEAALRLSEVSGIYSTAYAMSLDAKGRFDEAEVEFRRATLQLPTNREAQAELRKFLMRQGRLEEARLAWKAALAADPPEHVAWYGYAELCLYLGKADEYRSARKALLAKFGATTHANDAERTARACLLLPTAGDELRRAADLAERALAMADGKNYPRSLPYILFARGLAEYRLGRFDDAIVTLRGDASKVPGPAPLHVLAMALHQSGQTEEAAKTFAKAILVHDWRAHRVHDHDDWIRHILRREAEQMILPNLPAFLAGKYWPTEQYERDALIGVSRFTNRTHAVSRLYAEAFAAGPQRSWDVTGHRYAAACASALAGCGQGVDVSALTDPERARLRDQSRQWLRTSLAAWVKLSEGAPASRERVRVALSAWRNDPDLAGIRDAAGLAKLSEAERGECLALWTEVDAMFAAAEQK